MTAAFPVLSVWVKEQARTQREAGLGLRSVRNRALSSCWVPSLPGPRLESDSVYALSLRPPCWSPSCGASHGSFTIERWWLWWFSPFPLVNVCAHTRCGCPCLDVEQTGCHLASGGRAQQFAQLCLVALFPALLKRTLACHLTERAETESCCSHSCASSARSLPACAFVISVLWTASLRRLKLSSLLSQFSLTTNLLLLNVSELFGKLYIFSLWLFWAEPVFAACRAEQHQITWFSAFFLGLGGSPRPVQSALHICVLCIHGRGGLAVLCRSIQGTRASSDSDIWGVQEARDGDDV